MDMPPTSRPVLRFDRPSEWPRIKPLYDDAFGGPDEAELIEDLRASGDLIFQLVAEAPGEPEPDRRFLGALAFADLSIGAQRAVALVGPAIDPACQGQGIGSALVRAGLIQARKKGAVAACVLGDPGFWSRFGFETGAARQISCPWSGPYYMALALIEDLPPLAGHAHYPAAFKRFEQEDALPLEAGASKGTEG
ncbi:MAG: N-acetyltransferase [Neomegalonema sp.]|nr:N-acetyltransferase [Neomegalonema sp.]